MKKMIALALVLTLALSMASVAFAYKADGLEGDRGQGLPGETYTITATGSAGATPVFTKDYFKLSHKITKGSALVDSIKLVSATKTKDGYIELKVKENYTITDLKEIAGSITIARTSKVSTDADTLMTGLIAASDTKSAKTATFDMNAAQGWEVANNVVDVTGTKKADEADIVPTEPNTVYICEEDEGGYVKFSTDSDLLGITLKMASKEKAYMDVIENDGDILDVLEEKYPDAEIETYTFGGAPSFKNAAALTLQGDYSDQYFIYGYEGKKLTKVETKWNSEDGVYEWSTKAPRTYVISDTELVAADEETEEDEEDETKNPDTGANDVVGVAAALAVVSLVAAGAVSLKK